MLKKLIGTKEFYKRVMVLMVPIMVQNFITNFVNMLDNIMVGRVGTVEMAGVAVSNQLLFVFNLCIFGAISGAGIFGAQYYGKGDMKGVRDTFRFKIICSIVITLIGVLVFLLFGESLIGFYLKGEASAEDIEATMKSAKDYLMIMLIGLLPYSFAQCYSGTLREAGKAVSPMVAGIAAVGVNLLFNYFLIFGKCGFPKLGVAGAAIATVLSRFVELFIVAIYTHTAKGNTFMVGVYKNFKVPYVLAKRIVVKSIPLMVNETLWAAGMAMLNQSYSMRGLDVVAAANITQTFYNVFSVAFMAVGVAIGILLGQTLGSASREHVMEEAFKLITFSVFVSVTVSAVYFVLASFIPHVYNIEPSVMVLATTLMRINALAMPIDAYAHASYFTLRSGGRILETILFDCCYEWIITVPLSFILSRYTSLGIITIYTVCQAAKIIKCIMGNILVRKGIWIKNIVDN